MDPDTALDELLALLDRTTTLVDMHLPLQGLISDLDRIIELVEELDSWLTSGGFLPGRRQPANHRTV